MESDVGEYAVAELTRRGHQTSIISAQGPMGGHCYAILIGPDSGKMRGHMTEAMMTAP